MSDGLTIVVDRSTLRIEVGAIPVSTGGASLGPDLTAIEALTGTGIARRTAADTWTLDTATAAGLALLDDADAAAQRATLGLVIGTNVQAYDAGLASLVGVDTAADLLPYTTGANTWAGTALSAFARTLLDDTTAAAARATLGVSAAEWTTLTKSADQTSTSITVADVTDLGFTPETNALYLVEVWIYFTSSGTTIGLQWGIYTPATGTDDGAQLIIQPTTTVNNVVRAGATNAVAGATAAPAATPQGSLAVGWAYVRTGSTVSGQIRPAFNSEIAASAVTIRAGSQLRYRRIS